ncbi:MAG: phage portal protein [Pseudomonas sp.]|nr:phage portal protein [Pseudomonas sp.]
MIFKSRQQSRDKAKARATSNRSRLKRGTFSGADMGRLFSEWFGSGAPINAEVARDLTALRTRSRDLAKNSDYIRRFLQMAKNNVVGPTGFRFASMVIRSNGKPDLPARQAIERGWAEFSAKGVPCAQDRLSLWELQNLITESLFRDGEVILLEYQGKDENKFGLSYKLVDPASLDMSIDGEYGNNKVKMGIETDSRGRVVAYHFHSTDTTHESYYTRHGKGFLRIPKDRIIHRFIVEYPDQLRGIPHFAAAMARLKMLDEYEFAELTASRLAASTMGFIERGEDGGSLEGANAIHDEEYDYSEAEEPTLEAEAGAWHYIENGAKIHEWSPDHPTTAYQTFVKGVLRGIASSLGVSYNTLANDLEGVNFSSIRSSVLEDREFWKALQNWVVENVLTEIFNRWLENALLREALILPSGLALPAKSIERYRPHSFTGRRWAWVDPLKDISAHEKAITLGLRSRSSIIREQGDVPENVWREIQEENEFLKEAGILSQSTTEEANGEEPEGDRSTDD